MKSQTEILARLSKAKTILTRRYPLRRLALFGSYARNEQQSGSDIDILVDVDPTIGLAFSELASELEQIMGEPVEVVSRRAISPRHWAIIAPEVVDVQ